MNNPVETVDHSRRTMYFIIGLAVVLLLVLGLILYRKGERNEVAEQKADQLIAALSAKGLPVPSKDQIMSVLGDDGGAVCADPNDALQRARQSDQFSNGAGGPGQRPVIADVELVRGGLEILKVYCPEEIPSFQEYVDQLKSADVAE